MKRLIRMSIAGQVSNVSKDEITIEMHGNIMKFRPEVFENKPEKDDEVYCEIMMFLNDKNKK